VDLGSGEEGGDPHCEFGPVWPSAVRCGCDGRKGGGVNLDVVPLAEQS